jgi:hypothetical protein
LEKSHDATESVLKFVSELEKKGQTVPKTVSEIPNFPYQSYQSLKDELNVRKVLLQQFTMSNQQIFNLFATSQFQFKMTFCSIALWLFPISLIAISVVYSLWLLLLFFIFPILIGKSRRIYNQALFSAALSSELNFCVLFFLNQICLTSIDFKHYFSWKNCEKDGRDFPSDENKNATTNDENEDDLSEEFKEGVARYQSIRPIKNEHSRISNELLNILKREMPLPQIPDFVEMNKDMIKHWDIICRSFCFHLISIQKSGSDLNFMKNAEYLNFREAVRDELLDLSIQTVQKFTKADPVRIEGIIDQNLLEGNAISLKFISDSRAERINPDDNLINFLFSQLGATDEGFSDLRACIRQFIKDSLEPSFAAKGKVSAG